MREGELVWVVYRRQVVKGVVVATGRKRVRVHVHEKDATTWVDRDDAMVRSSHDKKPQCPCGGAAIFAKERRNGKCAAVSGEDAQKLQAVERRQSGGPF